MHFQPSPEPLREWVEDTPRLKSLTKDNANSGIENCQGNKRNNFLGVWHVEAFTASRHTMSSIRISMVRRSKSLPFFVTGEVAEVQREPDCLKMPRLVTSRASYQTVYRHRCRWSSYTSGSM